MRTTDSIGRIVLTAWLATGSSCLWAQSGGPEDLRNEGERIALRGAGNSIAACSTCHGALGEGSGPAGFPRIAGLPEYYLARQLRSYADGSRNNDVMSPIAQKLESRQVEALAAYYAARSAPPATQAAKTSAALMEHGRVLAMVGDADRRLQACVNCHGPGGTGEPPAFPYLAGQHREYLAAALLQWKEGKRDTDSSRQMPEIAQRLDERDREAVAAYFAAQAPPAPAADQVNIPVGSAQRPVKPGAPSAAVPKSTKGLGVEQGSPTTGGNTGPGGGAGGATGNERSGGR